MSKDAETTYNKLLNIKNFAGSETDVALKVLGAVIDMSLDNKNLEGIDKAISLGAELTKRSLSEAEFSILNYFLANAWDNKQRLAMTDRTASWEWEQFEIEKQIVHLRLSLREAGFKESEMERNCQIMALTNLGNLLDQIGRFVEALDYWERALKIQPDFVMALGNRGVGRYVYARGLYDLGQSVVFLRHALFDLDECLTKKLPKHAIGQFEGISNWIRSTLSKHQLECECDLKEIPLGDSEEEVKYRKWALSNKLFINPLNDLGTNTIPVVFKRITRKLKATGELIKSFAHTAGP